MVKKYFHLFITKYYLLFISLYYVLFNFLFVTEFQVSGILYVIFFIFLLVITIVVLSFSMDTMRFKIPVFLFFFCTCFFAKNIYYLLFSFVILFAILIHYFICYHWVRILCTVFGILLFLFFIINLPLILLLFFFSFPKMDVIDENSHYYCGDYEIYQYTAGVFDSTHYRVSKRYEVISFSPVIEIVYRKTISNEVSDYYTVFHDSCILVKEDSYREKRINH